MKLNSQRCAGLGLLALIFAAFGWFMVPAHFSSLWGDRDFTDWSVPIANRLHGALRLYENGLHSPMPPLPYVLPRLLFPQGGIWLDGSILNYVFQTGMILLLFWAFAGELGVPVALVTALATIPVYLSMPKTMLYDSMAQFLVAATGVATAALARHRSGGINRFGRWLRLGLLAVSLALLLLTKQSTAVGALAGVCLILLLLPPGENTLRRCANVAFLLVLTGVFFCVLALALNQFLSFPGLIHDVFLTGSEPKGGPARMIKNLVAYALQLGWVAGGLFLLFYLLNACVGPGFPSRKHLLGEAAWGGAKSRPVPGMARAGGMFIGAGIGLVLGLALALIDARTGICPKVIMMDNTWPLVVLNAGLCLVLIICASLMFQAVSTRGRACGNYPLAPYAFVFLFSALFHNLSVMRLRWTYDNNPLVFLALALVATAFCWRPQATGQASAPFRGSAAITATAAGFMVFIMWLLAHSQVVSIQSCTEAWPEVKHLTGARLRPESEGMLKLVETVRSFTNPALKETVLLLPEDPNVESWFERDRPKLSSAIIFTDQYWDRYVNQDFARLQANPPKVIVIGPRNNWRSFSRAWHINGTAERLIDLVREKMIAKHYDLKSEQSIAYEGGTDYLDVYVWRGDQP